MNNATLLAVVTLENEAFAARRAGRFNAASGLDGLASAVRSGQLTREQLNNRSDRCRLFGGRECGL